MKRFFTLLLCLVIIVLIGADCGKKKRKRVRKVIKSEPAVVMKEEAADTEEEADVEEDEEEAEEDEDEYDDDGGERLHTIVWRDTLGDLAYRYYRGDRTYRTIVRANPQIDDPDFIICGDKLKIPAK